MMVEKKIYNIIVLQVVNGKVHFGRKVDHLVKTTHVG